MRSVPFHYLIWVEIKGGNFALCSNHHIWGQPGKSIDHKGRQDRREALDWLRSLDFITAEDVEKGMQLYEETLAKRKQRQEDMANMEAGRQVHAAMTTATPISSPSARCTISWPNRKNTGTSA
ncbi:MAG: hypothetical protein WD139_11790 [Balneolaceae bacterium]